MDNSYILEIQKEYKKIDKKWLNLQYNTAVGTVVFTFFVECCIGILMHTSGEISTTVPMFILKYLIIPCILNATCILISYKVIHSQKLSQDIKVNIVSIIFVVICFIVFTIHIAFASLYFIFAIPILLTTFYGNYKLTTITGIVSLIALATSELFIKWDTDKISVMSDGIQLGNFIISLFVLMAFTVICMVVIHFEREKNAAGMQKEMERYKLQERLQIDELTRIYNRIGFRNAIRDMEEDDSDNTYIFVMIDIDNFKRLNDTLGHVVGDQCLIAFGQILKENCEEAIPFRYGGDEFCILFQNRTIRNVVETCEKIQHDFHVVKIDGKTELPLTASFGVGSYTSDMAPSTLIINTDKALYESKIVKNTITIYKDTMNE
ncbi:MAG: GGDEF domain-containing protein [Lachnotalea sp.]